MAGPMVAYSIFFQVAMVLSRWGEPSVRIRGCREGQGGLVADMLQQPARPRSHPLNTTGFDDSRLWRRTLGVSDSLEGKLLLLGREGSTRAATVHKAEFKRFLLNGTLQGILFGSIQQNGIEVTLISLVGNTAKSMGKVAGRSTWPIR